MSETIEDVDFPLVRYYQLPNGGLGQMEWTGGEVAPDLPEGATELTAAQYAAAYALWEQARADRLAADAAARAQAAQADYDALIAAGIPDATAQRLSGHTPPDPE
ncbi:hypothetical protein [Streptomyces sp. NPDC006334]|uniref:hypothetical protein n=1 Tax=Streptomyces sp. NPDC006334 TaxID=3156754 RepID=UPI0033B361D9